MVRDVPPERRDTDNVVNLLDSVTAYERIDNPKFSFKRDALVSRAVMATGLVEVPAAPKRPIVRE